MNYKDFFNPTFNLYLYDDGFTPPIKPIKHESEFCPTVMMELLPSWAVYICYDIPKFKLLPKGWLRPIQF